jgi:hypothetical protein
MQIPAASTTPLNWFQSEFFMDPPCAALTLPALSSYVAFIHLGSVAAKHFVLAPSSRLFRSVYRFFLDFATLGRRGRCFVETDLMMNCRF